MATIARGSKLGGGTNFNTGQIIDPGEVNIDFNTVFAGHNELDAEVHGGLPGAVRLATQWLSTGTPASTAETDLATYTVPADTLDAANSSRLWFSAGGTTAANANTKQIRVHVGSSAVWDSGALAANNNTWEVSGWIMYTTATTAYCFVQGNVYNTTLAPILALNSAATTWASSTVIKVTGTNGTASANDVTCGHFFVDYH